VDLLDEAEVGAIGELEVEKEAVGRAGLEESEQLVGPVGDSRDVVVAGQEVP
jgi:hypothetical protein